MSGSHTKNNWERCGLNQKNEAKSETGLFQIIGRCFLQHVLWPTSELQWSSTDVTCCIALEQRRANQLTALAGYGSCVCIRFGPYLVETWTLAMTLVWVLSCDFHGVARAALKHFRVVNKNLVWILLRWWLSQVLSFFIVDLVAIMLCVLLCVRGPLSVRPMMSGTGRGAFSSSSVDAQLYITYNVKW